MLSAAHNDNLRTLCDPRPILESLPFPAAIWRRDHVLQLLNASARELLGFSERDFAQDRSLWIEQIDFEDRENFVSAWRCLEQGAASASCRYRFHPGGIGESVGVRTLLYPYASTGEPLVWSVYYRDERDDEALRDRQIRSLFKGLAHEISNGLQAIRGEFDLLSIAGTLPQEKAATVRHGVDEISRQLCEANEFLAPPALEEWREDAAGVIEEVLRKAAPHLEASGIRLCARGRSALPEAAVDPSFRDAFTRVIEATGAFLPEGGELSIQAQIIRDVICRELEVRVIIQSPVGLKTESTDIFLPYMKVNHRRLGLNLSIARQLLRRQWGDIVFQKQSDHRRVLSILVKLPPESATA